MLALGGTSERRDGETTQIAKEECCLHLQLRNISKRNCFTRGILSYVAACFVRVERVLSGGENSAVAPFSVSSARNFQPYDHCSSLTTPLFDSCDTPDVDYRQPRAFPACTGAHLADQLVGPG
jgi:hypothetical protein